MNLPAGEVEQTYLDVLKAVKAEITIPVREAQSVLYQLCQHAKRMNETGRMDWCCSTGFISRTLFGHAGSQTQHFVEHAMAMRFHCAGLPSFTAVSNAVWRPPAASIARPTF